MAFDKDTRNELASLVTHCRRHLTDEFTKQCQSSYGAYTRVHLCRYGIRERTGTLSTTDGALLVLAIVHVAAAPLLAGGIVADHPAVAGRGHEPTPPPEVLQKVIVCGGGHASAGRFNKADEA